MLKLRLERIKRRRSNHGNGNDQSHLETRKTGVNEYTTKKTLVEEFVGEENGPASMNKFHELDRLSFDESTEEVTIRYDYSRDFVDEADLTKTEE